MKRKDGVLLFLSACIPGCGQMYQGYMKRGLSLLLAGCGLVAVASFLNLGELAIFLPVLWLFAFFDTYNLRSQTDEQAAANPDSFLFGLSDCDGEKLALLYRKKHSLVGWVLLVLGVYALYNTAMSLLWNLLPDSAWWVRNLFQYTLPRMVLIVLMIALGVWFIRGPKAPAAEEFPTFTPPEGDRICPDEAAAEEVSHGEQ